MSAQLVKFLGSVKSNSKLHTFDEAATKQAIILPLLQLLGWQTYDIDEVRPEYGVGTNRVDYSLRIKENNEVFLEAKKPNEDLKNHQEQLLRYSFEQGVELAILTNGKVWWFFLPLMKTSWEKRRFYTINIEEQDLEEVSKKFVELLLKSNVETGEALKSAQVLYRGEERKKGVVKAMTKAWNELMSSLDPLLLKLLAETTEKVSDYKPDETETREWLESRINQLRITPDVKKTIAPPQKVELVPKRREWHVPQDTPPHSTGSYFDFPIKPNRVRLIQRNILGRRDLWEQFVQKRELTARDFKRLSEFPPKQVTGFIRFITENKIADRYADTYTLRETEIAPIKSLLENGFPKFDNIHTDYFEDINQTKEKRIQIHILNLRSLWETFLEKKEMTAQDFRKQAVFKPKAIAGFFRFITGYN